MTRINIELGGSQYDRFSYPAGEIQVRFTSTAMLKSLRSADQVNVIARVQSPEHVIELALLMDAVIENTSNVPIVLILPYLPYARADRRFVPGDCLGVGVMARLLFSMRANEIVTLDAHSRQAAAWMDLRNISPVPIILQAIIDFAIKCNSEVVSVLLPDEGAVGRYKIPSAVGCNTHLVSVEIFNARKKRDAGTGKLSGFEVPPLPVHPTLIVDDICDGGGTFVGIAEQLPYIPDLGLYTTHGIYSKGLSGLTDYFKHLYTTNSFKAHYDKMDKLTVIDCEQALLQSTKL